MSRPVLAGVIAGAVLLGGGGIAWAQSGSSAGHYRTATATVGDVEQALSLSGTVASSSRRDLSFGADGTVSKVAVEVGDLVTSGQVLAKLDPGDLDAAVTQARADLAKAEAQLETDQSSQASTVTAAASAGGTTTRSSTSSVGTASVTQASFTTSATPATVTSPRLTKALAALTKQQTAVTAAQSAATDAIAASTSALAEQATACAITDPSSDDADDGDTGQDDPATDGGVSDACAAALDTVKTAQDTVALRQDELQTALTSLSDTLTKAITTLSEQDDADGTGGGPTEGGPTEDGPTGGGPTGGEPTSSGEASGEASGGAGPSAGSIANDQASIDIAEAALTEAKLARASATLKAPFAGSVLAVDAVMGASVGSSDVMVIVAGDGGSTVTTTVTVDQVASVEEGQIAHVTPAGASEPVDGTVTDIGMLPVTGDTVTYPVTIDLADDVVAPEGSSASVELVTSTQQGAVTVPSSAVSTAGRTTVTVLDDGTPTPTPVTVGVVGASRTAITEGLTKGQDVVIADLDAALPDDENATTRSITGNGGGPGGGGGVPPGLSQGGGPNR